jgi:hypothetical protein
MWKVMVLSLLAAVPSSTNYTLKSYDFGSGSNSSTSTNYSLRGTANSSGGTLTSTNYALPPGIQSSSTVPVPAAPTFTNPDNSYDRLQIVINSSAFPNDTEYAIAISSDNFVTTKYVKNDLTIASTFAVANYQTYAAWGGVSGVSILGLTPGTTYSVKIAALQGAATGSAFGPAASAATSVQSVTFGLSTNLTATPPFAAAFSNLPAGSVTAAGATVTATITTNAEQGGQILIKDQNSGLTSPTKSYTIASSTADLSAAPKGYGAQISSTSQAGGGPMIAVSPFNGVSNNVGALSTSWQQLASFAAPITTGSVTFALDAKTDTVVPAAADYADLLTLSISLLF